MKHLHTTISFRAIFVTALVVTISYSANQDDVPMNTTNTTNSSNILNLLALSWPLSGKRQNDTIRSIWKLD